MENFKLEKFDENDWYCFAGAEGDDPKVAWDIKIIDDSGENYYTENDDWALIVDESGIQLHGLDYEKEIEVILFRDSKGQEKNEEFVKKLSYPFRISELFGFGFFDPDRIDDDGVIHTEK